MTVAREAGKKKDIGKLNECLATFYRFRHLVNVRYAQSIPHVGTRREIERHDKTIILRQIDPAFTFSFSVLQIYKGVDKYWIYICYTVHTIRTG